jgi:hypothetical protein
MQGEVRLIPLLVLLPVVCEATPAVVQASAWTAGATSSCAMSGFDPTAGNNIVVLVAQDGNDTTADYAVSDSVDGSYTHHPTSNGTNSGREVAVFSKLAVTTTSRTITVTQTNSTVDFACVAVEVSTSVSTTLEYQTGGTSALSATTSWSGASAGVSSDTEVIVFAVGAMSGTPGSQTLGSGYSLVATVIGNQYAQYKVSASAVASETGPWTITNARSGAGGLAVFRQVGSESGGATCKGLLLRRVCD